MIWIFLLHFYLLKLCHHVYSFLCMYGWSGSQHTCLTFPTYLQFIFSLNMECENLAIVWSSFSPLLLSFVVNLRVLKTLSHNVVICTFNSHKFLKEHRRWRIVCYIFTPFAPPFLFLIFRVSVWCHLCPTVRIFFSTSVRAGLLVTDPLVFSSSEIVWIEALFWKSIFTGYAILG